MEGGSGGRGILELHCSNISASGFIEGIYQRMVPGWQSNSIEPLEIFMNENSNGNIEHQTNRQNI